VQTLNLQKTKAELDIEERFLIEENLAGSTSEDFSKRFMEHVSTRLSINHYEQQREIQFANARENMLVKHKNINDLIGKYKNRTTISVAFGPSLSKNIDHLIKIKDKYKIISVDRAYDYLRQRGIETDVVVACDALIHEQYLGDHPITKSKLIAHVGTNPDYVKKFIDLGGEVYFYISTHRFGLHAELSKLTGLRACLNVGGNVGNAGVTVALDLLTVKKLLLVGYDHSFGEYYYPGIKRNIENQKVTTDINGDLVYVELAMGWYNDLLIKYIYEKGKTDKVVNCTEGGILDIPLKSSLSNY